MSRSLDEARAAPRRRSRALQGPHREVRAHRRVLPAPARVARVRDPDRRRDPLPVPRLEVRRRPAAASSSRTSPKARTSKTRSRRPAIRSRSSRRAALGLSRPAAGAADPAPRRLRRPRAIRTVGITRVNCNWLQIMENSRRSGAHRVAARQALRVRAREGRRRRSRSRATTRRSRSTSSSTGSIKRRLMEGQSEDCRRLDDRSPDRLPERCSPSASGADGCGCTTCSRSASRSTTRRPSTTGTARSVPAGRREIPQHLLDRVPSYDVAAARRGRRVSARHRSTRKT